MACWENRGCDDEMRGRCVHAANPAEKCPLGCLFSTCDRSVHQVTSDPALVFDPAIDRAKAAKEICVSCEFFLTHGPRLGADL